jgi:hypothetical protein
VGTHNQLSEHHYEMNTHLPSPTTGPLAPTVAALDAEEDDDDEASAAALGPALAPAPAAAVNADISSREGVSPCCCSARSSSSRLMSVPGVVYLLLTVDESGTACPSASAATAMAAAASLRADNDNRESNALKPQG